MATTKHTSPVSKATRSRKLIKGSQARTRRTLRTEPRTLAFAVGTALLPWTFLSPALAQTTATTLPPGGQYAYGTGTISQPSATKLQIDQRSDKGTINWNTFSIGSSAWVNFSQPSASSLTVNRVLG